MIWCNCKKCDNFTDGTHCCFIDIHLDKNGKCKDFVEKT